MPRINYKCNKCGKEFEETYLFLKPANPKCPHCGASSVSLSDKNRSCGCNTDKNSGYRFT